MKLPRITNNPIPILTAFVLSLLFFSSCKPKEELSLSILLPEAESVAGSQFISIKASGDWTLTIESSSVASADWVWLSSYSSNDRQISLRGSGNSSNVALNWDANDSQDSRSCTLTLSCAGERVQQNFLQKGSDKINGIATELKSDKLTNWLELPATKEGDGLYFITHSANIGGKYVRNYSFYWDPKALVAHWVAYPLNRGLISTGSRTDLWDLNPKVPREYQPVLFRGYSGGSFQRGHQLPSADRYSYEANIQTFYGTNITPQRGALNENIWATLETTVRDWSKKLDTLYVVTGCVIDGSTEFVNDNEGKKVTVPTGYYKALLGYKQNASIGGSTKGFVGVAFYFEHRGYSNDYTTMMKQSMTISALENKLGMDFFVNLPAKIGVDLAKKVETSIDPFWK